MRVLMISGDRNLARKGTSAHERFKLQVAQVDALVLALWPQQFLKPFLQKGKVDIVTSQDPFWRGVVALLAARIYKAKLNIQVHADLEAQSLIKRLLARIVLVRANSVRVVSERVGNQVSLLTQAPVSVLPIFVDVERFRALSRQSHPRFSKVILWIGRFEAEKDPLLALEVVRKVREAGIDAGLVMLGKGRLGAALHARALSLGVASHVEFAGWQDPTKRLGEADVVLCTSQAESYGASIIEALAAGVPVVAPDVGLAGEAGALITEREMLAQKTIEVLRSNTKGHLALTLPDAETWAKQWRETLN